VLMLYAIQSSEKAKMKALLAKNPPTKKPRKPRSKAGVGVDGVAETAAEAAKRTLCG
jgi:hypothetical protein